MRFQLSLKNRVYLVNTILLFTTLIGAGFMIWYTYRTEKIFKTIIEENIVIYQSAEALGTSLINQKGFVSYYLLDKNPSWLEQLSTYTVRFDEQLTTVESIVNEAWERKAVTEIRSRYKNYVQVRNQVIELYKRADYDKGTSLHRDIREDFSNILNRCEQFKAFHKEKIAQAVSKSQTEANRLRYIALLVVVTVIFFSLLINYIFTRHILEPIRMLARETDKMGGFKISGNEVAALKENVYGLMESAQKTHEELKQSREFLMQSEKMALLGKLAAGTAHSIRNPLTSVKMRLFSLNRSCEFTDSQQEDFNVISGEIKQINKIVENFLEFSRPPRLRVRRLSPSEVVDSALSLLDQRLNSYGVTVTLIRNHPLAETAIDPEQLKEVLVNIIINACEVMDQGGGITIEEEEKNLDTSTRVVIIRISDNGPGIPAEIMSEIFNPFFTTKEEGTGLGLSIAFNIINEHKGWLDVQSEADQGAIFTITLPI